jgi:hypothetical protein
MSMTNLQGIICWAHARYFFTLTKMVAGYRVKSSPLQAIHQFNPSQPTEILSMKNTHWLSKQTVRADHESRTRRKTANEKRKFYS